MIGKVSSIQGKRQRGFTLLELMIVVVIVAILAVIALPNYTQFVYRANRVAGKSELLALAQQQESYFSDRKKYASIALITNLPGNFGYLTSNGTLSASASSSSIYRVSAVPLMGGSVGNACSGVGTPSFDYLLIATPMNAQNGDSRCMTLCLASTGDKGATGTDGPQSCWQK